MDDVAKMAEALAAKFMIDVARVAASINVPVDDMTEAVAQALLDVVQR